MLQAIRTNELDAFVAMLPYLVFCINELDAYV